MRQVAEEAGVGLMTVSYTYTRPGRVAAGTRARVLEAADRLGYRGPDPTARSLRSGSTGNLGVVLGEHLTYAFEDPQAARFLAGVSRVCVENRLGLVLIPTRGEPDDVDRVREAAVDGFVLWTTVEDDPVLAVVAGTGRPAAVQGGPAAPGVQVVSGDDRAAARAVGRHMLAGARSPLLLSHPFDRDRRSGLVRGPDVEVPFPVTRARLEGFRDAVTEGGGTWADVPVAVASRNSREHGRRAVAAAQADVRPDAVVAMSDQLAAGARDVLGPSVPVSGWDDSDVATALGFPSIRQSLFDQGVTCARVAAGLTTGVDPVPWELVLR
jgi:DNA-binding LacI/PurR family transcriptional regulator